MDSATLEKLVLIAKNMQRTRDREWATALRTVSDTSLQEVRTKLADVLLTGGNAMEALCGEQFDAFHELCKQVKTGLRSRAAIVTTKTAQVHSYNTNRVKLDDAVVAGAADCFASISRNAGAIRCAVGLWRERNPSQPNVPAGLDDQVTGWLDEGGGRPAVIVEEESTRTDSAEERTPRDGAEGSFPEVDTVTFEEDDVREAERRKRKTRQ